jgi:shikimate kinase
MGSTARDGLLREMLDAIDPRLEIRRSFALRGEAPRMWPAPGQQVVLVGHRASGKSRLLPLVGMWLQRSTVELDAEIARRAIRDLREWVERDPSGFRRAERETFLALPKGQVIAAGGGFLSHHPDLLSGQVAVLVPVSFETYRERLLADRTRPRLRPELSLEEEIVRTFEERERLHARANVVPLIHFLAATLEPGGAGP